MEQLKIDRINALAKKAKSEGLTPEETRERDALRAEYISTFKNSLIAQLDNTYIIDENGSKHKLEKKDEEK